MTIYSGFSPWTWWFPIAMLVYQRVIGSCWIIQAEYNHPISSHHIIPVKLVGNSSPVLGCPVLPGEWRPGDPGEWKWPLSDVAGGRPSKRPEEKSWPTRAMVPSRGRYDGMMSFKLNVWLVVSNHIYIYRCYSYKYHEPPTRWLKPPTSHECQRISGWWFQTWLLFSNICSIPYMGCHPSQLTNSYFSRWLKPPTRCNECHDMSRLYFEMWRNMLRDLQRRRSWESCDERMKP